MKLKRSQLLHYIDANMGTGSPKWFLIGKDIEDMSVDLGVDVSTRKNILDETSVKDAGYEPTLSADPYYANTDDDIYEPIVDIAMNRKKNTDCETKILEVLIEDTDASSHKAWMEDCLIKPTSYGGDTEGVGIPFNIYFNGNRKQGTVTLVGKVPTFSE